MKLNSQVLVSLISVVIGSSLGFAGNYLVSLNNNDFALKKSALDRVQGLREQALYEYVSSLLAIENKMKEIPFSLHKENEDVEKNPYLGKLAEAHAKMLLVSDDKMIEKVEQITNLYVGDYLDFKLAMQKRYYEYVKRTEEDFFFAFANREQDFVSEQLKEYVPRLSVRRDMFLREARCDYISSSLSRSCEKID